MSIDWDRETIDKPFARHDALASAYEARLEEAREEAMEHLGTPTTFALLLKEEPRYLTNLGIQLKVIAIDRLEDEGFSGSEAVRESLIDDLKERDGWFSTWVASERD